MLIQPITVKNYQRPFSPRFKGGTQMVQKVVEKTQPTVNSLVDNSAEKIAKPFGEVIISSIKDISNFLKANVAKIDNGKIFNVPITPSGNTLLQSLVGINEKQIAENEDAYLAILYKISKMNDIDFNQKDSLGLSLINKIVYSENKEFVELIKDKDIEINFATMQDVQKIKNPEFKKLFSETKAYKNFWGKFDELLDIYSSNNKYNATNYNYKETEIDLLKEYIKLLNYNASENKKEILDKIFQTTMAIAGEATLDKRDQWAYINSKKNKEESKIKAMLNLYNVTDCNKTLFKDLLIKSFSRYTGERDMYFSGTFMPILAIFKDSPDDFIDIFMSLKYRRTGYYTDVNAVRLYQELEKLNPSEEKLKQFDKHLKKADYPERISKWAEINELVNKIEQQNK